MGFVTFSLDTESIWGRINDPSCSRYLGQYEDTSEVVFRLISLFEKYDIPATWAFVGLSICDKERFCKFAGRDYKKVYSQFEQQHFTQNLKLVDGRFSKYSLLPHFRAIRGSRVRHEVASHTFSHLFGGWQDVAKREESFLTDLQLFQDLVSEHSISPISFIYPRNFVYSVKALGQYGFRIYRGEDKDYQNIWLRRINKTVPLQSFIVQTSTTQNMTELPGSMIFRIQSQDIRRILPMSWLYRKAKTGIDHVLDESEGIFHIWFHPFNFAFRKEDHFYYFEKLLKKVSNYREAGRLKVLTMKDYIA